jgi:hypothetical protein
VYFVFCVHPEQLVAQFAFYALDSSSAVLRERFGCFFFDSASRGVGLYFRLQKLFIAYGTVSFLDLGTFFDAFLALRLLFGFNIRAEIRVTFQNWALRAGFGFYLDFVFAY